MRFDDGCHRQLHLRPWSSPVAGPSQHSRKALQPFFVNFVEAINFSTIHVDDGDDLLPR